MKNEKQKLNNDLNDYIKENQKLKNMNNELSIRIKLLESNLSNNNANNPIISDKEKIGVSKMKANNINILEDLIPVIFQSKEQKITYAIICRTTDKFNIIENILYEKLPELEENEQYENKFTIKGRKVLKSRTIAQNNINYSDIIEINKIEI